MSDSENQQALDVSSYRAILQGLYDSVLITDTRGAIVENNHRAEELLLFSSAELLARTIRDVVSGLDEKVLNNIVESFATQKHVIVEASCLCRNGTVFPAEIAVSRIDAESKPLLCFSIRNVTSRNQTQQDLEHAQEKLLTMERIKARMETITTLAHEINNPLQALLNMVEADKNVRYAKPLNRIAAVMHEMRREEELKSIKYAGTSNRFALVGHDMEACNPKNILVVDDESVLVKFFETVLRDKIRGLMIECASNGAEALATFQSRHHAVIILDICMPVMDGEKAFHEIKKTCKDKKWEMPAVIFCTGYTPPPSIQEAIASDSAHCYLAKPMSSDTLVNAVKNRLELYDLTHGGESA